jgi:hypothetical protein
MPTIDLNRESADQTHADRWVLASAVEVQCDFHGTPCRGIKCVFRLGDREDCRNWGFPNLRPNFDAALADLVSHVGKEVKSLIDQPPTFLRIDFVCGAYWSVQSGGQISLQG